MSRGAPGEPRQRNTPGQADTSWMEQAKCGGILDFTEASENAQLAVCTPSKFRLAGSDCPVRMECFESALSSDEPFGGVHGGVRPDELRRLRKRLRKEQRKLRAVPS